MFIVRNQSAALISVRSAAFRVRLAYDSRPLSERLLTQL